MPAAIIISAGFSELGAEGRALEAQIRAARGKMRIIGPNCLGVIHPPSNLNASFAAAMAPPGRVALLEPERRHLHVHPRLGAGTAHRLQQLRQRRRHARRGLRRPASTTSATTRPRKAIILYMESIGDVRKFLSAARSVSRTKHVIVVKSGRHEAGASAAASHTGALAGSDAVFDAAFRRAGVLRVTTIPDLFNMSEILSMQPPPRGPALAIITNAGGPGVMAVDDLMTRGGQLAAARRRRRWPPSTPPCRRSGATPTPSTCSATPRPSATAWPSRSCAKDATVQGVLILLTPQAMTDPTETARQVAAVARQVGQAGPGVLDGRRRRAAGPRDPQRGRHPDVRRAGGRHPRLPAHGPVPPQPGTALRDAAGAAGGLAARRRRACARIIAAARAAGRTLLTEAEAKELLAAYGLPVTPAVACRTADEAVAGGRRIGFPVVLKLLSTRITHKSDVGGVQLNLADETAVRDAFERIRANVAKLGEADAFEGVTVQPMVTDKGIELIIGSSTDRQFGPVVLFGAGGVLVEVLQDRALGLPPLNRTLARRLMERTRIYPALAGRARPEAGGPGGAGDDAGALQPAADATSSRTFKRSI